MTARKPYVGSPVLDVCFTRWCIMKYYNLKSIHVAGKSPLVLAKPSLSFFVAQKPTKAYIAPTLQKVIFEKENPTIILISAVGASGKTALAEQLSYDTQMPLLDLSKHKPVGDNTLTGLITHAFEVADLSSVFKGLETGSFGIIVDGLDEGMSKTKTEAFEAFLDDIVKICGKSQINTFVILGRTQKVDECWDYLTGKGVNAALLTISPFSLDEAGAYIDAFAKPTNTAFFSLYEQARDAILSRLGNAFQADSEVTDKSFLSFIGYPPVLDAIVTLLKEEHNYHKLLNELNSPTANNVEVDLLYRIANYILAREKDQKVFPNIVKPIINDLPPLQQQEISRVIFSFEEQAIRLVAQCLSQPVALTSIGIPVLDDLYEAQLSEWIKEHPFVEGRKFRSAVFESLALATLFLSN